MPASTDQQVGVWCEVGVQAQRRAAHDDSDVVTVARCCEFGGDESAKSSEPGSRSAFATHLAIQRMRHSYLDATAGGLQRDEAAGVGLLDRGGGGDPRQGREVDRLAHRKHVDHVADRRGQCPDAGFDQIHQAGRHDRVTNPPPTPVLLENSAVGDLLLDDVPQIQDISTSQREQSRSGFRIDRSAEARRQQRGGLVERKLR
jgi:hypothetical protein